MDIAPNPSATFLGSRMFGSKPEKVAPLVVEGGEGPSSRRHCVDGQAFPRHGNTAADSHHTLPVLKATLEEMEAYGWCPSRPPSMPGWTLCWWPTCRIPMWTDYITSISPTIITGLLRNTMGFKGVVFSDDIA